MTLYSELFHASTKSLKGDKSQKYPFYCLIHAVWAMHIKQAANRYEGTAEAMLCHLRYLFLILLLSDP